MNFMEACKHVLKNDSKFVREDGSIGVRKIGYHIEFFNTHSEILICDQTVDLNDIDLGWEKEKEKIREIEWSDANYPDEHNWLSKNDIEKCFKRIFDRFESQRKLSMTLLPNNLIDDGVLKIIKEEAGDLI